MRVRPLAAVAVLLAAGLGFPASAPARSNAIPPGIDWVNDWDRALATAAERGVPVIISFANDD